MGFQKERNTTRQWKDWDWFYYSVQQNFEGVSVTSRTSHKRCSVKKAVLKNFSIFTEKYLFSKVAGPYTREILCKIALSR